MINAKVSSTIFISTGYTINNFENNENDNNASYNTSYDYPPAMPSDRTAQLLESLAWLEGVPNTPAPIGFDDFGLEECTQAGGPQGFLLDPPLFPSPTTFFHNALAVPSPSNSQSQSLLSLSPSSSITLDADSLLSFDTPAAMPSSQGGMSDAEFQLLLDGLSPEDVAGLDAGMDVDVGVNMDMDVNMGMMMPCEPFVPDLPSVTMSMAMSMSLPAMSMPSLSVSSMALPTVDNFALHAFPSLDMFAPASVVLSPVPSTVPSPAAATATSSEADHVVSGTGSGSGVRCRTCHRSFPTLCRLRKHEHTHTKPFACTVCHKGHAAKKDLHRHLWSTHPEAAAAQGIPNPMRVCPVAGCGFESRQDNLTRHIRTKHPEQQ